MEKAGIGVSFPQDEKVSKSRGGLRQDSASRNDVVSGKRKKMAKP